MGATLKKPNSHEQSGYPNKYIKRFYNFVRASFIRKPKYISIKRGVTMVDFIGRWGCEITLTWVVSSNVMVHAVLQM